jgi:hypothetical protein
MKPQQTAAPAQAEKPAQLEDVVVTAEFRKESARKTPLSMTAITSATPNANLSLRGVGSGRGNAYADPTGDRWVLSE